MQRDFNNKDFEQFVKQNADQYRMFPSEKVWQGIDNALHTRRRWYGFGLALLLLLTGAAVTLVMVNGSKKRSSDKTIASVNPASAEKPGAITATTEDKKLSPVILNNEPAAGITAPLFVDSKSTFPTTPIAVERTTATTTQTIPVADPAANATAAIEPINTIVTKATASAPTVPKNIATVSIQPATDVAVPATGFSTASAIYDNSFVTADEQKTKQAAIAAQSLQQNDIYPLTIESVINSYQSSKKKNRFSTQFYIAPTISYRKLSENKKFLEDAANTGTVPVYAAYSDINNYVNHKPDMGLELGFTGKYALSESFKLRAGLQFNVSRYDIQAAYGQQREDATIALDAGIAGVNQTITRPTNYRNASGNNGSSWLKNLYYSVSLPVGAEVTFKSRNSTHFGIAATIQPTYIIKNRAYLISTDYKNYVEVPSLVRKVNLNTSFEAFVAYSTGNINWQIGPQVRYQVQSSFKAKYPFKENLFDFGLKVGIQLNR